MAKITCEHPELLDALRGAGIDVDNTKRVIIDIQAGSVPLIYTEQFGTDQLISIIHRLDGMHITMSAGALSTEDSKEE